MSTASATKTTGDYRLVDHDVILNDAPVRAGAISKPAPYVLRFRDIADESKPRERLLAQGPKALSVAELMAVVLGVGTQKEDVLAMSQRIIKEYGSVAVVNETSAVRLAETLDIPTGKACQVIASFELGRRYFSARGSRHVQIRNSKAAYEYLRDMGSLRKEQLRGLYLNSRYGLVHDEVISLGSLTANIVHPREVFQPAIEHGAVAVILAHNHPSGSFEPTVADMDLTDQLASAGRILGIDLIDHLVITGRGHISIMQK